MQESAYVSPEEAATYFGLTPETIRRLCRAGKIPGARRVGGVWRIPRSFLQEDADKVQELSKDDKDKQ